MNARASAIAFAILAIVLTLAQDVFPGRDWYHGWQYVTVLAIVVGVMIAHVWRICRGGAPGRRFALALAGAIATGVAGLLSGLIGPDTITVVGTPGTVTPVPDLKAAVFFPAVDAPALAKGDAAVTVRKRDGGAIALDTHPLPIGLSVAYTEARPAAFVVARDTAGRRLTVTQPNNPSFLSPIVVFRQTQDIHGRAFPLDTIAVPGVHRIARILYFSPAELAAARHETKVAGAGAILSVSDDAGAPKGLTLIASGATAQVDNVRYTVTLGRYPVVLVASAPQPLAVAGGIVVFIAAGFWSRVRLKKSPAPVSSPSYSQS